MTQIAALVAVSGSGTVERARVELPVPASLEMRSLDRTLAAVDAWAMGLEPAPGDGAERLWLTLDDTGGDLAAPLLDGIEQETCDARLLGVGVAGVVSSAAELASAFAGGFIPSPSLAVRREALASVAEEASSSGEPDPTALAAALAASGRRVRLLTRSEPYAPKLDAALTIRRALGHVPARSLRALASAGGAGTPAAIRRAHARLNGDAAARRSIAESGDAAAYRALGCALRRPIVREEEETPTVAAGRLVETELGRWRIDDQWADSQIRRSRKVLAGLRSIRASDDCVIVGNGRSLRAADPELFRRNDVIVSNFAALSPLLGGTAKILTVVNGLVAEQGAAAFNLSRIPVKIAPLWLAESLHEDAGFCFVDAVGEPAFLADDPAARISWAATVSFFNMQIAYHLGYRRVMLVGFDHAYAQNEQAAEGAVLEETRHDPNHFDSLYFAGKRWQKANLDLMQQVYILARTAFEADGREILNLSPESALTIFPKVDPAAVLAGQIAGSHGPASYEPAPADLRPPDGAIGEVDLSDIADGPDYRHLNFGFRDVRAGERIFSYFFLKLQQMGGRNFLEIRRGDIMPVGLAVWPETHARDEWGDYLRLDVGEPNDAARLRAFLSGLTKSDRHAVSFLLGAAGGRMRTAIAGSRADIDAWGPHVAAMERMIADAADAPR